MAIEQNGNTIFISSTGSISTNPPFYVSYVTITGEGGAGDLKLQDLTAATPYKLAVKVASGSTLHLDYSGNPLVFPTGINVHTATTVSATLVLKKQGA